MTSREAFAAARVALASGEFAAASDALDGAAGLASGSSAGDEIAASGALRAAQRDVALAAWGARDLAAAERAALRLFGFAPPNRASGDIEKPLSQDGAGYRIVPREVVAARVLGLTGGARTTAPACCAATTRMASMDRSGFDAITRPGDRIVGDEAWLLSPLDASLSFLPCSYGCAAAQAARRATLAGRDLDALRRVLATRLLRLAPGLDLLIEGRPGRSLGALRVDRVTGLYAAATPAPLVRLVETLVVRRLVAGAMVRFEGEAVDLKQGLVFVKMLHRTRARWLDLA